MEKIEYRAYIKTRCQLGIPATGLHSELVSVHGTNAPQYRTVAKWAALYRAVRESLEDDPRIGRPITASGAPNVERIRNYIEGHPHASFLEMEEELDLSRATLRLSTIALT